MEIRFEDFERHVMGKLLSGRDDTLSILYTQYVTSQVKKRDFSDVGFYTHFLIDETAPRLKSCKTTFHFGDVTGALNETGYEVGFVLFVKDGTLNMLEGYTFGNEEWPQEIRSYRLIYNSDDIRDLNKLKRTWYI